MHELSLAMNMVEQIERVMKEEGAQTLVRVKVEIGALSGVEREPMAFCFPVAIRGTALEGAELEVKEVPLTVKCLDCDASTHPEMPFIQCQDCESAQVQIVDGRDFKITSIEVE